MNFLEKVAKISWTANETWKIERELEAARCFVTEGPSLRNNTASFADLFSKRKLMPVDIPEPNPKKYIPGRVFFPKDVDSILTKREQAISLTVLQYYQSSSDSRVLTAMQQQNIQIFQTLQSKIQEENTKFLKYVEEDWKKWSKRAQKIKPTLRTYARLLWEKKLLRSLAYPQFYKSISMISLLDAPPVEVSRVEEALQLGKIAEFCPPSLLLRFMPKPCSLPDQEGAQTYNSKLPVSLDDNIEKLLINRVVDVVISSSALKLLMDNSDYNIGWDIAIVVKQHKVKQANGSFLSKNVVYIDKPFPKRNPSNTDFNLLCHKRLVRTNFCIFPKVMYPNWESTRENPFYNEKSADNKKQVPVTTSLPLLNKTIQHNVSYDIWSVKLKDEENQLMKTKVCGKEIKLLIRYKFDACECLSNGEMRPLVLVPKLEYQLEHGANIASKSELIRQWTSLFFRPFSHLYRVRMQVNSSEVVSIESVNLQKINNEAINYYNDKPVLRLGALYKIFSELIKLDAGNYLLRHTPAQGPFADILKAEDSNCRSNRGAKSKTFDLHFEYSSANCKIVPSPKQWCPIDVHYILPVHATYKRMPGMFKPLLAMKKKQQNALAAKKRRRKNAAKKKKQQAKKAKQNEESI